MRARHASPAVTAAAAATKQQQRQQQRATQKLAGGATVHGYSRRLGVSRSPLKDPKHLDNTTAQGLGPRKPRRSPNRWSETPPRLATPLPSALRRTLLLLVGRLLAALIEFPIIRCCSLARLTEPAAAWGLAWMRRGLL